MCLGLEYNYHNVQSDNLYVGQLKENLYELTPLGYNEIKSE